MANFKGASRKFEVKTSRRRKDLRPMGQKLKDYFLSGEGVITGIIAIPVISLVLIRVPFSAELILLGIGIYRRKYLDFKKIAFDFPYRVPVQAKVLDGSTTGGKSLGKGVTLVGTDIEYKEQIYAGDSDLRTHALVLGTTGSGKTEFLLGLVFNALVQNTGFIYVDGKGDPKLQKDVFRLARYLGREEDLLIVNFITSGRDFVEKQADKVTNNMNIMGNTSSGMLIELIVALMDDSGGGGDMWKGRAISFVAALTRPLTYLRDKGFIGLSPEDYLSYFELHIIEELVFEHGGKYGDNFDVIVAPLKSYLKTLPGYQDKNRKKQETKTLEQHGFIIMQLTRIFNDLTFNYGHIFKTKVGDVDFFDVVVNRRLLTVLLPALERAPDSMRMLGKMIVGSIKQMMAGCLGNKVEGVVREIIDSRPTNADFPFYTILDEYGYYAVIGFAVAPAQARSLGFSVIFAAQDFSSLKKSSAEEADATWENTNIRAIGRITSGEKSETWERIIGAASDSTEAELSGFERITGAVNDRFSQQNNISLTTKRRLHYDDLARQENGEFTFLIGKKENSGQDGGVRVIRGMGFYTAGKTMKEMRINDFIPVESPEPRDLPETKLQLQSLVDMIASGKLPTNLKKAADASPVLKQFSDIYDLNTYLKGHNHSASLTERDITNATIGYYLSGKIEDSPFKFTAPIVTIAENFTENAANDKTLEPIENSEEIASELEYESEYLSEEDFDLTVVSQREDPETKMDVLDSQKGDFDRLSGSRLTEALLAIAMNNEAVATNITQTTYDNKQDNDEEHTLHHINSEQDFLSEISQRDVDGFEKNIKVFFDFSDDEETEHEIDLSDRLINKQENNRQLMTAMYHAQLMLLFSRGEKPSAQKIRDIKDDVENEYQKLLNSTSYLNGQEPQKVDAATMRQSISLLGAECGKFVKMNLTK
ncbi:MULTISPECIES: TraM recognition domain-containing protein [Yersinia pseudotuberculosis complex]|uniref:Putative type IV secretion system protein IcmO/DotL n=1 Tax=Yersinia pseudotuberculosis serotype O:1b (strain IP 31758) TaxID=349747 RepID=A0A0U1QTQ8_YERP3|nr:MULTISPECIES: TraM recognition domain-containing protein [Yersinia pseudotuberculosis complex]ABS45767.1 putative type IV secretion system protein IcmO/DotL [Yersinia pseudotuberculosis IP 31758]MCE4113290.1 TraM recognition domain-containing protein [Yersinia pseudotuberculosis]RYC26165.1 type IV secretion system protein IcmO/DotL [Yersinia pseudotuberculosis]UFA64135.1 TraM recognition domain-containing protein [Yersinia pseudotuberculosis]WLF06099.1 TraM recognition domain-containing pro